MDIDGGQFKRVKKFDSHDNETCFVFEFDGEMVFLTQEDVETHLKKYFKIREKLREEKKLRKEYDAINEAWEIYQAILLLHKKHKNE